MGILLSVLMWSQVHAKGVEKPVHVRSIAPSWTFVGAFNFDRDGRENDLLWWNRATGEGALWIDGSGTNQRPLPTVRDINWRPVEIADFDGDGRADILWKSALSGAGAVWFGGRPVAQTFAQMRRVELPALLSQTSRRCEAPADLDAIPTARVLAYMFENVSTP